MTSWKLNPIIHTGHSTLITLFSLISATQSSKIHTFEAQYDLDIENQDVTLSDYNIMTSLNLNPIVIGVTYPYLSPFQ